MRFPLMLRKTYEEVLDRATDIIVEKNRVIAVQNDELAVANRIKTTLQDRNEKLNEALTIAEGKIKKLEEYLDKLMQMANYLNMELDFAYNLFVDFEENEDIAYAFVNGLAAGKDEKNKEIEGKNEEE